MMSGKKLDKPTLTSVMLIDNNSIDNFISYKMLKNYGVERIVAFTDAEHALNCLLVTNVQFQLILIDLELTQMDSIEFIEKYTAMKLHQKHGEICFLAAYAKSYYERKSKRYFQRNYFEKPLTASKIAQLEELLVEVGKEKVNRIYP